MTSSHRLAEVFVELADTLVDEFDALDFLGTLTERSVELLPVVAAGVILRDRQGTLHVVASTNDAAQILELFELQNEEGPCLDCLKTGLPVVNLTELEAGRRWPRFTAAAQEAGFAGVHAIPLHLRSSVVGAMNIFCATSDPLTDADLSLGQALADVATIGLLQERAVRESGLLAGQLQRALNSRVVIEQAKGVLLASAGVDVDQAFGLMREYSRRTNRPLREIAAAVVARRLNARDLQP